MNNNNPPIRYKELDALRGIAALLVVLFHFTLSSKQAAKLGFKLGTTGVDLFFLISGFVIFMSVSRISTSKEFIINRVSRLYPTYWACVSFTFLVMIIYCISYQKIPPSFIRYLGNMTMFQYYLGIRNLDGPYWTMIIEMLFYISILFLFHFKLLQYINPIGLITSITVAASVFFFDNVFTKELLHIIPLLQFLPLFFAGIIFYKIHTNKSNNIKNYGILLICLVCQILLYNYSGRSKGFISHGEYAMMLTIYFFLFTLFVNRKLSFIISKPTLFFGKISFALYLIHQYISYRIIIPILVNKYHFNFWIASIFVALPIVIGVASLITYYIEIPFGAKMKEKLRNKWGVSQAV